MLPLIFYKVVKCIVGSYYTECGYRKR